MIAGVPHLVRVTGMTPSFIRQKLKAAGYKRQGRAYRFKSKQAAEDAWTKLHRPWGHKVRYVKVKPSGPVYIRQRVKEHHA